jgi:hypothetical protein
MAAGIRFAFSVGGDSTGDIDGVDIWPLGECGFDMPVVFSGYRASVYTISSVPDSDDRT